MNGYIYYITISIDLRLPYHEEDKIIDNNIMDIIEHLLGALYRKLASNNYDLLLLKDKINKLNSIVPNKVNIKDMCTLIDGVSNDYNGLSEFSTVQ